MELQGLRIAITGGTSGLGLALVREFFRRGAHVAFVARTREQVERVAREHPGAHGIVGDVANKNDIYPIALQITGGLGGLDVLVNNASSLGPTPLALLGDTECEDVELALATNLLGPFRLTKALLGALGASAREGRGAVVLNVSRRGDQRLSVLGRVRREQGGVASLESNLERRALSGRHPLSLARSGRHGHAAARVGRAGCRFGDARAAGDVRARIRGCDCGGVVRTRRRH